VWRMHVCTHPHFHKCEISSVYAARGAMACVRAASLLEISDMLIAARSASPASLASNVERNRMRSCGPGHWRAGRERGRGCM